MEKANPAEEAVHQELTSNKDLARFRLQEWKLRSSSGRHTDPCSGTELEIEEDTMTMTNQQSFLLTAG